jgi:galactose mutarotase-like enzyme
MDRHSIASGDLTATILAAGAELCSLIGADGTEYLWQAGPVWPRHAPVLFPIVGRLKDDTLRHQGRSYRLTQHGFARDRVFTWIERTPTRAHLALMDDEQTRAMFPFGFRLELIYDISGASLTQTFRVGNTGDEMLPASFGAHPAFAWPLRAGVAKEAHTVVFGAPEPAPLRRLSGGLMLPDPVPSPIEGDTLHPRVDLFAQDALIWDQPVSRSVRYGAPGGPAVTVAWVDMPQLGIWTKPGDFLCIEPWHGFASPVDFDGPFAEKPGLMRIPPGDSRVSSVTITISSNPD